MHRLRSGQLSRWALRPMSRARSRTVVVGKWFLRRPTYVVHPYHAVVAAAAAASIRQPNEERLSASRRPARISRQCARRRPYGGYIVPSRTRLPRGVAVSCTRRENGSRVSVPVKNFRAFFIFYIVFSRSI